MSRWKRGWKVIKGTNPKRWKKVWVSTNKTPNKTHYSPNFARKELDCKCGCKTPPLVEANLIQTAKHLEKLRKRWGRPLVVTSGHRCRTHNARVGGASDSQHLYGRAADIVVESPRQGLFVQTAEEIKAYREGGIGTYPKQNFVHLDWRGYRSRWNG